MPRTSARESGDAIANAVQVVLPIKPYLSYEELAERTPFTVEAWRSMVKRGQVLENVHYFRVGRRITFKWEAVVTFIEHGGNMAVMGAIPLARGGVLGEPEKS